MSGRHAHEKQMCLAAIDVDLEPVGPCHQSQLVAAEHVYFLVDTI